MIQSPVVGFPYAKHTLIRASAGTGKTYALSCQYIALLYQGASPRSILATTFTRKAAGEILGRVMVRLAQASGNDKAACIIKREINANDFTTVTARQLLARMCGELHRVNVSTLDAFFSRIAGSFRLELDLPMEPQMVAASDPQAAAARAEAIDAMLSRCDPAVMVDILRRAHHDQFRRSVTKAIDDLVSRLHEQYRMAPDKGVWSQLRVPRKLDDDELAKACEQLAALVGSYPKLAAPIEANLKAAKESNWETFLSNGPAGKICKGEKKFRTHTFTPEIIQAYKPLMDHIAAIHLSDLSEQTLSTWELLGSYDEHYVAAAMARRLLLFSDLPLLLNKLPEFSDDNKLGRDAVYYRLDGQVSHLLLDEFQDTSPLQWEVLRPLAREITGLLGTSRSFFCVGDAKQSIYSWRGGCPELFDELVTDLCPDSPEEGGLPEGHEDRLFLKSLSKSYRSSPVIMEVVNRIFTALHSSLPILEAKDEGVQAAAMLWSSQFTDHQTQHAQMSGHVKFVTSGAPDASAQDEESNISSDQENNDDHEGDVAPAGDHENYVADYIKTLAGRHPTRSLGVLVRTNAMVNQLIQKLQEKDVPASGEGGNPVTDDPAVQLVLSALRLADYPGDAPSRHHLWESPAREALKLVDPSPSGVEAFSQDVRRALSLEGYVTVISRWAQALVGYGDKRTATRLSQLVQLAQGYEPQATSRPMDFVDMVNATPVEEPMPAKVRVMTIHKSKGLEFDIVVLPELHKKMAQFQRELFYIQRDHPTRPATAIHRYPKEAIRAFSAQLREAHRQEIMRRLGDEFCSLYVAITRARRALYMIAKPLKDNSKAGSSDLCPASILRSTLGVSDEQTGVAQTLYEHGSASWDECAVETPSTQPSDDTTPSEPDDHPFQIDLPRAGQTSRSWRIVAPSRLEAAAQVNVQDILRLGEQRGRAFGSLIHAMFQQIDWLDDATRSWDISAMASKAARQVPQADRRIIDDAIPSFTQMLNKPAVREALSRPTPEVDGGKVELWRERPFAVRLDGSLIQGVLDRVVIQRDAKGQAISATIIDYKTDRLKDEGLDRLVTLYRPQMQAYRRSLAVMVGLKLSQVTACLLLPAEDRCVVISEDEA